MTVNPLRGHFYKVKSRFFISIFSTQIHIFHEFWHQNNTPHKNIKKKLLSMTCHAPENRFWSCCRYSRLFSCSSLWFSFHRFIFSFWKRSISLLLRYFFICMSFFRHPWDVEHEFFQSIGIIPNRNIMSPCHRVEFFKMKPKTYK